MATTDDDTGARQDCRSVQTRLPCPVCAGLAHHAFHSRHVPVAQCVSASCGHLFAYGVPDDAGLQTHSVEHDSLQYENRNRRLVEYFVATDFLRADSRVLDVGAGAGHVSDAIRRRLPTSTITCVEGDPGSQVSLRARGYECQASLDEWPYVFDAILLIEVIEHVPRPIEFLQQCAQKLAPGGRIFLTTPCGQTARGSRRTNAYETAEHVHFFTERSLRLACDRSGLVLEGFRTLTRMYPRRTGWLGAADAAKHTLIGMRERWVERRHLIGFVGARHAG